MEVNTKRKNAGTADLYLASPTAASGDAVCNFWKEFDLEGYRSKLDEAGLRIAENQEASLKKRRQLAEKTKEFKKGASAELTRAMGPLLRLYQDEVDKLSSRAKFGESAFLDMYQKLYEAPDPAPSLGAALEMASRCTELEASVAKLSAELAEYKAESSELKNQTHTIRGLQEKVRGLEAQLEEKGRQVQEAADSAAAAETSRMLSEVQEREARLAGQLAEARASLDTMRQLHAATQNQLFTMQSKTEEEQVSMQRELELATSEMDRAHERLMALEREKEAMATTLNPNLAGAPGLADESLREELSHHRAMSSKLQAEVHALQQQLEDDHAAWAARVSGLEASLDKQEAHARALEKQLAAAPSHKQVEELRQQVRMLQAVAGYSAEEAGLGASEGSGGGGPGSSRGGAAGGGSFAQGGGGGRRGVSAVEAKVLGSLEAMLLDKNRHLEHEVTMARLQVAEMTGSLEANAAKLADAESEVQRYRELVARMEEDLTTAQQAASWAASAAAAGGHASSSRPVQADGIGALLDGESSSTIGGGVGNDPFAGPSSSGGGQHGEEEDGGSTTMVKVLCSQRDRFRARVRELEEINAGLGAALAKAKKDVDAARADNVALVERLRYVQGYRQGQGGASGSGSIKDVESGGAVERKYSTDYEQRVDPFAKFRAKEQESRRRQMGVADRAVYLFGQFMATSKLARTLVFFYTLALHALVFFMVMHSAHSHSGASTGAKNLETTCAVYCEHMATRMQGPGAIAGGSTGGGVVASVSDGAAQALGTAAQVVAQNVTAAVQNVAAAVTGDPAAEAAGQAAGVAAAGAADVAAAGAATRL